MAGTDMVEGMELIGMTPVMDLQEPEQLPAEVFPQWRTGLVRESIPAALAGCESLHETFFVQPHDAQYEPLRALLTETLQGLLTDGAVGDVKFLGPRAREALQDIVDVLGGKKTWKDIEWVFSDRKTWELYKNEVYAIHGISDALCYNIDLGKNPGSPQNPHRISVERIHVMNHEGVLSIEQDGRFTIKDAEIEVDAGGAVLHVHDM